MYSSRLWLAAICLFAAGGVGFVIAKSKSNDLGATIVRSYVVPENRAEEVRQVLNRVFWKEKDPEAMAQMFGGGLLLVRAPKGYHDGIGDFIDYALKEKPQTKTGVRIDYWLVVAEESSGSNSSALGVLAPVLQSVEKIDGERKFRVLEHVGQTSLSNQKMKVKGAHLTLDSMLTPEENAMRVDLRSRSGYGELDVDTIVKPGDFVIIGQNAVKEGDRLGPKEIAPVGTNVYHVLRTQVLQ